MSPSKTAAVLLASLLSALTTAVNTTCPDYTTYSQHYHAPFSGGHYNLSSQRPVPACRTFNSSIVESTINNLTDHVIKDPDLKQLFRNAYPNTLDTTVRWRGHAANNSAEELAFVITGDINAMWLRDSANQLQSYAPLLKASSDHNSLASLYRGVINLQARYLLTSPYCQSFQAPAESGIPPAMNGAAHDDQVVPPYSNQTVFECKFELDSLAAFLEVSANYFTATKDAAFFGKFQWLDAVQSMLNVADSMFTPTYAANGSVNMSPYTFERTTTSSEDTLDNSGVGNPVQSGTGLVRSAFRPSDDACIYQLFIPANAMFSRYLAAGAAIIDALPSGMKTAATAAMSTKMKRMSASIRGAIGAWGITVDPKYGPVYAFEVDGFGGINSMDDANIPSLLSLPFLGYFDQGSTASPAPSFTTNDKVYQNTRRKILSADSPYYARGPVLNAVGGPHDGPGHGWPMAAIVTALTSTNDTEIAAQLKQLVSSTDGLGLIHESINAFNQTDWTRQWFAWANGLFGQMVLDLADRKPQILGMSFQ